MVARAVALSLIVGLNFDSEKKKTMKLLWMFVNVLIHAVTDARDFKSVILK